MFSCIYDYNNSLSELHGFMQLGFKLLMESKNC